MPISRSQYGTDGDGLSSGDHVSPGLAVAESVAEFSSGPPVRPLYGHTVFLGVVSALAENGTEAGLEVRTVTFLARILRCRSGTTRCTAKVSAFTFVTGG
jgi:hypothetical protein